MPWLASGYSVAQCALLTSCPSCPVVLCRWSRPGPAPAAAAPARSCAPPEGGQGSVAQWSLVSDEQQRSLTISSLGTVRPQPWEQGTGFLGLCSHSLRWWESVSSLTTTEQPYSSLSHLHHTHVTCNVKRQSPYFQATEQVLEDPGHGLQLRDGDAAPVHGAGLLPVEPLHNAVRAERMLAPE